MGVPVGVYDGLDDAGFGEGACFGHLGLLSRLKLHVIGKALICQGNSKIREFALPGISGLGGAFK
jgi:hypothetical protein